jgi:hypothetical protein
LPLKEGAYGRVPPPEMNTKAKILAYGQDVLGRFKAWWDGRFRHVIENLNPGGALG